MGIFIKQDHTTWRSDFLGEIDLLNVYFDGLKQHLVAEKERFHNKIEVVTIEENEEYARVVSFFRGLDDETWALDHIFSQHFPNLLLRSTLITFYSFAEVALDTLCDRFSRHLNSNITIKDFRDKGIERAKRYLTKICNIDFRDMNEPWTKLKMIAEVRNLITHNDGRIGCWTKPYVLKHIRSSPYIRTDKDELILSPDYLNYFLVVIQNLIEGIGNQIETQQNLRGDI